MTIDRNFLTRIRGTGLITTEDLYGMPGHRKRLQSFAWQTVDPAPAFRRLQAFLRHGRREIEAIIPSVDAAHSDWVHSDWAHWVWAHSDWIGPARLRSVDGRWVMT